MDKSLRPSRVVLALLLIRLLCLLRKVTTFIGGPVRSIVSDVMPAPEALAAGGLTLTEGGATDGALTLTADAGALSAADAGEQG